MRQAVPLGAAFFVDMHSRCLYPQVRLLQK